MPRTDAHGVCSRSLPLLALIMACAAASGVEPLGPPAQRAIQTAIQTGPETPEEFAQRVRDALPAVDAHDLPVPRGADVVDFGRGPLTVYLPDDYDPSDPRPLVLLLHGYTSSGPAIESWFRFAPLVNDYGFIYLHPTGTSDALGNNFWNATDACCDLFGSSVNDAAYLRGIIDTMKTLYAIDPRRVHIVGHSNGGFMAHRMACEHADAVASIVSLAGAIDQDASDCTPAEPVHALQVHGTSDSVISYNGGCIPFGGCYPSATETAQRWAMINACAPTGVNTGQTIDLDASIAGAETNVTAWDDGCDTGGSSELWTIPGGAHSPPLTNTGRRAFLDYLFAHPKPSPCPADFDGDGVVNVLDVVAFITNWNAQGPGSDFNADGNINILDIVDFITAWSAGCP